MAQKYIKKTPYYGVSSQNPVEIQELVKVKGKVESTVSFGGRRIVFRGNLVVDHIKGSWRWGEQIAINLWTKDLPEFQSRANNDGYSRVAIALPPELARRLCEKLLEKLWGLC